MMPLNADVLLAAYMSGYFPMARSRNAAGIEWFHPATRGIIPLEDFHIPHRLAKTMRQAPFAMTADTAFPHVIAACAAATDKRPETWINDTIIELYCELWQRGHAHSVECWRDGELVGGLYGVAIGGAFCGESMFSRVPNASKVALAHTLIRLRNAGYVLFDTQYINPHLMQFGTMEIPREDYLEKLEQALHIKPEKAF